MLPLLMLLLLGIMEFGIVIFTYDTIANAARDGARYGIIHPDDVEGIKDAALYHTTAVDLDRDNDVDVFFDPDANTIQVEVTYDYSFISGPIVLAVGLGNSTLNLHTVATMHTE